MDHEDARKEIAGQLVVAAVMLFAAALIGTGGYYTLGGGQWRWDECFYMTIITLSTVGFGEVLPHMDVVPGTRIWTLLLILFGSGSLLFFVSTLTAFLAQSRHGHCRCRASAQTLSVQAREELGAAAWQKPQLRGRQRSA